MLYTITEGHSNQDPPSTQQSIYSPVFLLSEFGPDYYSMFPRNSRGCPSYNQHVHTTNNVRHDLYCWRVCSAWRNRAFPSEDGSACFLGETQDWAEFEWHERQGAASNQKKKKRVPLDNMPTSFALSVVTCSHLCRGPHHNKTVYYCMSCPLRGLLPS